MKIIYFIDHLRRDGTQFALKNLVEGLSARGHEQWIICLNDSWDAEFVNEISKSSEQVQIIGKIGLFSGVGFYRIWKLLKSERFDAAVTFLFASDLLGKSIAHCAGIPRIITSIRARNIVYKPWQKRFVRYTMRWADAVVLNSAQFREYVILEEGANPNHIRIIPNGVDVERYQFPIDRKIWIAQLSLPEDALIIGSVGRLTWQKGFDILIEALSLLEQENLHLLLIGEGEEEVNLRNQAADLGIQDRVHFLSYRRDVPRLLGAMDLYIQPSRFEGMPNSLLEAMAAGCPVIASGVDGNNELIEDCINGWLVPSEEPQSLADSIQQASKDRDCAERYGRAAQQSVVDTYNIQKMVLDWEKVLRNEK